MIDGRTNTKSDHYKEAEERLIADFKESSIPDSELLENLQLFITPQNFRRLFFWYEVYQKILAVPGNICQFGVRWGRELALFETLRTMFEPFNHSRHIVGFDTFSGYPEISQEDGSSAMMKAKHLSVSENYEQELQAILRHREQLSPLEHVQKFSLVKGDCRETFPKYLEENPHTLVSLAHLDVNLYEPSRDVLIALRSCMPKGSIIVIDEVNCPTIPGETIALKEIFNINELRLCREVKTATTWQAYFTIE